MIYKAIPLVEDRVDTLTSSVALMHFWLLLTINIKLWSEVWLVWVIWRNLLILILKDMTCSLLEPYEYACPLPCQNWRITYLVLTIYESLNNMAAGHLCWIWLNALPFGCSCSLLPCLFQLQNSSTELILFVNVCIFFYYCCFSLLKRILPGC